MRHAANLNQESNRQSGCGCVAQIKKMNTENTNGQAQSLALISTVEQLHTIGTRAVRVDCSKPLVIGKQANGRQGDLKLSAKAEDAPAWMGNVWKKWANVGILNVDWKGAVNRYLASVGNPDAGTWEPSDNWHTRATGSKTRSVSAHREAQQDVYLKLVAWYTDGNLFTTYHHGGPDGPELSQCEREQLTAHLYARKAYPPTAKTSTGKVALPMSCKTVAFANVSHIQGLPDMLANDAAEIKGVQHLPALVAQLGAIASGQNISVDGPRPAADQGTLRLV